MWLVAAGIGIGIVAVGATAWSSIVSDVEQAPYTVAVKQGDFEVRDYASMIAAQTEVAGERKEAINQGFRTIADYIFGKNAASTKIAMTAPVMQQPLGEGWQISFVMPSSYTLASLPKPDNAAVRLAEIPGRRLAVVTFSGFAGEESLREHTEQLNAVIKERKLQALSQPVHAFFNPPWTLPFLRRNEVMVEVAK